MLKIPELIPALVDAGHRLASAGARADLGATVPSCPEWTVRDLVFHQGSVHRWAETIVREARAENFDPVGGDPLRDAAQRPPDDELIDWFRIGHAQLVATLEAAPADLECWTFLRAPSPLHFWVRRQTHETTIHRVDAELAVADVSPLDPRVAADGIDELLTGFVQRRRGRLRSEAPKTLGVHAIDTGDHWQLSISADPVGTQRTDRESDATLRGPAVDVYLALWNRLSLGALDAFGDAELLGSWSKLVQVRWS